MTREEAIDLLDNLIGMVEDNHNSDYDTALQMGIKALEQEPCDDCISRDMALEKMADYVASGYAVSAEDFEEYSRIICQLPPVTPQSKMGHWEWVQYDYNPKLGNWHCSECHCVVLECVDKEAEGDIPLYKYCPQCGAKM